MRLLLVLGFALFLSGCSILDDLTGVDDAEVVAGEKRSVIEQVSDGAEEALPWPWSLLAGGVLGTGAMTYRRYRVEQKKREEEAA